MLAQIPVVANSPKFLIEIGSLVGDYRVTALCNAGPRATVYRAEHTRFLRQAALKVINKPVTEAKVKQKLEGLLGKISQVRHANVAELYDFGFLENNTLYLIQEWVDGYSLEDTEAEMYSLSVDEKFLFLQSLASAIDEVHLSDLMLVGLHEAHVLVESKRGRAKLIAYAISDALESLVAEKNVEEEEAHLKDKESGQVADYRRLGSIIKTLLLSGNALLSEDSAEKVEVIVERCQAIEASDPFSSGNAIMAQLKGALGLAEPKKCTLEIGTLVGESYKITGVIGKGGMGQVYEGAHVRLPQRVAIKVIEGTFTEEANIRFRQEAEIAASLGHPHLVRVIDFNTFEDGQPYMVMELLEGEDLGKSMRNGPLSPRRAVEIAKQVGSALTAVHKKGIVHRDLKPPNVFLGKVEVGGELREHATVLDFGVSKKEDATISVTKTSAVVGTPQYMAPEQALGENDTLTAKADQFSLGSLLYEMLSGTPAFGRGTLAEVVYRVCQEEPPPLRDLFPDLPVSVSDAVQRAMSKRAEDRFESVADFVEALSQDEVADTITVPLGGAKTARDANGASDSATAETVANKKSEVVAPLGQTAATALATKVESAASEDAAGELTAVKGAEPGSRAKLGMSLALVSALGVAALAFVILSNGGNQDKSAEPDADTSSTIRNAAKVAVSGSDAAPQPHGDGAAVALASPDASAVALASPGDAAVGLVRLAGDAGVSDAPAQGPGPTQERQNQRRPVPEELPKEIIAKLDQAERLIKSGRYREARRVVSRDKRAAASTRGRAVAVKSYCGENNFGAAQDWLRRLPKSDRPAVIAYCQSKHQIELH